MSANSRARRGPLAALLSLGACVLIAAAIWSATVAIQREWIAGPDVRLQFGAYYVLAQTTGRPECLPLPLQPCLVNLPIANTPNARYYVVWVGEIRQLGEQAPNGLATVSKGRRIFQLLIQP